MLDFWHSVQPLNCSSLETLPWQALSCSHTNLETVSPFCFLSGLHGDVAAQRRRSLAIRQANNVHGCGSMIRLSSRQVAPNKCFSSIMLIFQQGDSLCAFSVKLERSSREVSVAPRWMNSETSPIGWALWKIPLPCGLSSSADKGFAVTAKCAHAIIFAKLPWSLAAEGAADTAPLWRMVLDRCWRRPAVSAQMSHPRCSEPLWRRMWYKDREMKKFWVRRFLGLVA